MKIYIAHASSFDFKTKLYEPIRKSELEAMHEIILPHEDTNEENTRETIKGADVVVAEVSLPSLGVGIEMGWADAFGHPIIAMYEKGSTPSFSIDNVVTDRIEYGNTEDLIFKLKEALGKISLS